MTYPQSPQGGPWLPPPAEGYYQQAPRRSGIPKVIGILMIILGSLGMIATLASFAIDNDLNDPSVKEALGGKVATIQLVDKAEKISYLIIGILHIAGGIMAVMYKRAAPAVAITYAVLKILTVVIAFTLVIIWVVPVLDKAPSAIKAGFIGGLVFGGVLGIAWPVVVWALMSRPAARAACDR
jgi:hypothetical protein